MSESLTFERLNHGVLPADATALLKRAASTPITRADPLARVKAIEQATKRVRAKYPDHFRVEPE